MNEKLRNGIFVLLLFFLIISAIYYSTKDKTVINDDNVEEMDGILFKELCGLKAYNIENNDLLGEQKYVEGCEYDKNKCWAIKFIDQNMIQIAWGC